MKKLYILLSVTVIVGNISAMAPLSHIGRQLGHVAKGYALGMKPSSLGDLRSVLASVAKHQFSSSSSLRIQPQNLFSRKAFIGGLTVTGFGYSLIQNQYALAEEENSSKKEYCFEFDRECMVPDPYEEDQRIEGYWASSEDPDRDHYKGKYPFPKANPEPWPTQEEFMTRLKRLTEKAKKFDIGARAKEFKEFKERGGYAYIAYRGYSPSRLEPNVDVGYKEYVYQNPKTGKSVSWTEAFGSYYVKKFNVKPSKEFYDWVMNNPDGDAQ